ncbi:unnamed protein product [Cuscuta campestris]|uniref:Retrovirus-related Pol polyprotein from transposon TNT 1-94-like beta-barrel domain-containing protein n=1 Tax=Cuscuta campestris TaxID=132261 RepID=A0A484LZI6_9ASTE|nr:unnamed protein product [Cuscuta campestris]
MSFGGLGNHIKISSLERFLGEGLWLHAVPFQQRNKAGLEAICSKVGKLIEMDESDVSGLGKSLREREELMGLRWKMRTSDQSEKETRGTTLEGGGLIGMSSQGEDLRMMGGEGSVVSEAYKNQDEEQGELIEERLDRFVANSEWTIMFLEAKHEDDEESEDWGLCIESSIDSWVMDSGTSVHATHSMKMMKNLKIGDFGKRTRRRVKEGGKEDSRNCTWELSKLIQKHRVVSLVIGDPPAECSTMKEYVENYTRILNQSPELDHIAYTMVDEGGSTQEANKTMTPSQAKNNKKMRNKAGLEAVCSKVGKLIEMDESDVSGLGKSLRVRMRRDINKPLCRGRKLTLEGKSIWVYFKSVFQPCMETMADEKIKIEKFDGSDFGFWKMQIEDVLYQKDLYQTLSGEKPEKMSDADWAILDRKALGVVRLSLAKSVAFNIVNETTTHGLMKALSNMYEKPSALNKMMKNLKIGDFGKVRLGNDEILDVTGMGDIDLKTSVGATWTLKNVRVIPSLKRMLISVGQLDDSGLDVKFGGGQWKVVKGNLVVARGKKRGSLYMVEIPPEGASPVFVKEKVRFKESRVLKRVTFAKEKLRERVQIQDELARKVQPVREFCDSGSTGRASVPIRQWVRKTSIPALNVSPVNNLLGLENVGSQFVLEARRVIDVSHSELAEKENESRVVTDELKLSGSFNGPSDN